MRNLRLMHVIAANTPNKPLRRGRKSLIRRVTRQEARLGGDKNRRQSLQSLQLPLIALSTLPWHSIILGILGILGHLPLTAIYVLVAAKWTAPHRRSYLSPPRPKASGDFCGIRHETENTAMKKKTHPSYRGRLGYTLIELIVVLTILVGLAGILIPAVSNMVVRTNRSTSAANIAEIALTIQRHEAVHLEYPDRLDGLMSDLLGTDLDTLNTALTPLIEDVTLDANTLAALNTAGIATVGIHTAGHTTFDLPAPTTLTDTTVLKGPTAAHQVTLGLEATGAGVAGKYIVLGVGASSELNGKSTVDAPVHFPRDSVTNPDLVYSRFLAIFQITDGAAALTRARFVGVMAPDGSGLSTSLSGYYNSIDND